MFLTMPMTMPDHDRLPRAGGGVSIFHYPYYYHDESSPRRWGCFLLLESSNDLDVVFPAQVGVFPVKYRASYKSSGLPRAGGGVSGFTYIKVNSGRSSPRRWGCF